MEIDDDDDDLNSIRKIKINKLRYSQEIIFNKVEIYS